MIRLYNTLSRSVEDFTSINANKVSMYSCGPTVYDYQHIGHMRRYVGDDILIRVLKANGYDVHHVMNITDVGHLVSDSDTGEDKMEKGAKKYGVSVWDIAHRFEKQFVESAKELGIQLPEGKDLMHATDYIKEQIALIQILEEKGYTYKLDDGIYYNTSKFPTYFALSRQNPDDLKKGARVDFVEGKKNASDFALWKFSPAGEKRQMEWESPWGVGFPGWHIECSAMSMKALGETLDIHTGGIDHISIHHSNEIAQSEAATGKKFVNYWVHHNFLVVEGEKMSKSLGNFFTVQDVVDKGYDPLSLRYVYLQTHYRQEMNFTWEALDGAQKSLDKLRSIFSSSDSSRHPEQSEGSQSKNRDSSPSVQNDNETSPSVAWMKKFMDALNDDLNTAKALAVVWEMVKEDMLPGEKKATLLEMDKILGLELGKKKKEEGEKIPDEVQALLKERKAFRKAGDWKASDELRKKIEDLGFAVQDSKDSSTVTKLKKD